MTTTIKHNDWDAESVSRAADMLAQEKSTREIAEELDATRNGVLGLCSRRETGAARFGLRDKRAGRGPEEAA